jgi:hypothetical protein
VIEISYVHIGKHSAAEVNLEPHMKSLSTIAMAIAASALFASTAMAAAPKDAACKGKAEGGTVKSVATVGKDVVMTFTNNPTPINIPLTQKAEAAALAKVKPGTLYCVEPDPLM